LFSPRLWTADGLATEAGREDFWDRSTLYALRGVFAAGATQRALDFLTYYSNRRLLGDHVPYPVEAYPEGNQRHLSAESALYCRIFTEGVFGLRPTGLRSFSLTPRLPKAWPSMTLKRIHAFGSVFDLTVTRAGEKLSVQLTPDGQPPRTVVINDGDTTNIDLTPRG
jgi:cellobiose phosphorylase